jgi:hypothetical protein
MSEASENPLPSSRFRNPLARLTLAGSREYITKAAERSAEAITDALDAYRKAAQEPGGALKRVALREEFTIVLDTSARMLYLAVAVLVLYGVIAAVGWYGSSASAVGSLLFVGAAAVLVMLIVHTMLFFFARSDQKVHAQVVTFNIGQTIATRLTGIDTMRSFIRELVAFQGEFLGGAGAAAAAGSQLPQVSDAEREEEAAASSARKQIEDFLKRMATEQPLELFGLHKIKSKKRRVRWLAGGLLLGVLTAGAVAIGLSVATGAGVLGMRTLAGEQLALDDVAASGDGGGSWSRAAAGDNAPTGEAWLSPQADVFHAPFGPRSDFGGLVALEGGNAVLVAGGAAPQGKDARSRAAYADVWRGERVDGRGWVSWSVQTRAAPWGRRWGHQVVRAGSRLVLVGGVNGATGEVMKDVWTSDDGGASWARVGAGFPGRARYHHAMVAVPKQGVEGEFLIVLVGGVTGGAEKIAGEVWWSQGTAATVGTSWSSVGDAPNQPFGEREAPALAAVPSAAGISAAQAAALLERMPDDADRTVDGAVLGAAELQQLPSFAHARLMALVEARAASVRAKWDGGNANAPTADSLLGRALAAGLAAGLATAAGRGARGTKSRRGASKGRKKMAMMRRRAGADGEPADGEADGEAAAGEAGGEAAADPALPPVVVDPEPTTPPDPAVPAPGPEMATDAQKRLINAILGSSRAITTAAHLAAMTAAHANVLLGNDSASGDLGRGKLREGLSALWKAPRVGVLILAGGPAGRADRARGTRAPLEVFSSADGGVSWSRLPIADASPMPVSRRGHALVVRETAPNQAPELVLAGGFQTARGKDAGMPLGDVWVSGDAGMSWRRVGSGPGRLEQISSGPYDIPRRAHFGMAAVTSQGAAVSGTGLLVVGGDATGTPEGERKALGLFGAGLNPERETVPDQLTDGAKVQVLAAAAAIVLLVALLAVMHLRVYRALYRDIPLAYVRTEKAWRESLEAVAANPQRYEVPGSFAKIGSPVRSALRSAGTVVRSVRSQSPMSFSR